MSVLDFLGEIFPWPASRRLEDVLVCKGRLILQADALRAAVNASPWECMLAHACDRGAAAWEHWLLKYMHESPGERELTAHSAITLAQRSGDWLLVSQILDTWATLGERHRRFYRDGLQARRRNWQTYERELNELGVLGSAVSQHADRRAARNLLSLTESYAARGGPGVALHARADAHQLLGEPVLAQRTEFAACIANPHEWRIAWNWLIRNAMAASPMDLTKRRVLAWYDKSGVVHAAALFLANRRQASDGPPPESLIASTLALRDSPESKEELTFVYENIAWAFALRGELARAEAILAEAISRMPNHPGLADLREATTNFLLESQRADPPLNIASSGGTEMKDVTAGSARRTPVATSLIEINDRFARQVESDLSLARAA
jgi:hypothetical protein